MYTDLNKSYEELEASYKRELERNEPFRAKIAELQHELLAANDRIASLRHDFRLQQSKVTDLEVRYHVQSQSLEDVADQCSELQKLADKLRQMLSTAETDLQDARNTVWRLNSEILDAREVAEELTQQAS
jgi:chromosome segregation ATPase